MARFVCFNDGLVGSLQRILEFARRLDRAGHDVIVASPIDITDDAARAGVRSVHLDTLEQPRADLDAFERPSLRNPSPRVVGRWLRAGRAARRASLRDRSIEALLAAEQPDLAFVEIEFYTAAMACAAAGVPVALTSGWFCALRHESLPPLDSSLRPGLASPEEIDAAWTRTLDGHRRMRRRSWWSAAGLASPFRPVRPVTWNPIDLNAFARSRGLSARRLLDGDQWPRPFVVADVPIISFTPSVLEFGPVPDRWHVAGAMTPPPSQAIDRMSDRDRSVLRELLERRRAAPSERPLVFVGLGTYWTQAGPVLDTILETVSDRTDLDVVVGLGGVTDRRLLGDPPGHIAILDWAPQSELLAEASVAIIHGGVTSLLEGARVGVPMICLSTHTNDQDGTVARAEHAGIAIGLDHRSLEPSALSSALDRALDDAELAAASAAVSAAIRSDDECGLAVQVAESLVADASGAVSS